VRCECTRSPTATKSEAPNFIWQRGAVFKNNPNYHIIRRFQCFRLSVHQYAQSLLERLTVPRLVQKEDACYEPEGSLPSSQETTTCPGQPAQSTPRPRFTSSSSILLSPPPPAMPRSSKWSLSVRFPTKTPYASPLSAVRVTRPDHLIPLDLIARMMLGEEPKPLGSLCKYDRLPCYVLPLTTKYLPQNPVIEHPHLTFFP